MSAVNVWWITFGRWWRRIYRGQSDSLDVTFLFASVHMIYLSFEYWGKEKL